MTDEEIMGDIAGFGFIVSVVAFGYFFFGRDKARPKGAGKRAKKNSMPLAEVLLNIFMVLGCIAVGAYLVHEGKATWTHVAFALGGFAVYWVGLRSLGRDKDGTRLAQAWRPYAAKHGDQLDVPGRFAYLSLIHGVESATESVHAKLKGARHGVEFEADIASYAPGEISERGTSFHAIPRWMCPGGGVTLSYGPSDGAANSLPTLERHGVCVYAKPPALAEVFQTAEGDAALLEVSKRLPPGLEVTAFHQGKSQAVAMIVTTGWCDEEKELDDTIEVLTRICALSPPADTFSRLERS